MKKPKKSTRGNNPFKNNQPHGWWDSYKDGVLLYEGLMDNGKRIGLWSVKGAAPYITYFINT